MNKNKKLKTNECLKKKRIKELRIINKRKNRVRLFTKQWKLRLQLRKKNINKQTKVPEKQETNFKKIQTFLRKIQRLEDYGNNADKLIEGVWKYTLKRYLEEIIKYLILVKKMNYCYIWTHIRIISALHQRFGNEFTSEIKKRLLIPFNPEKNVISDIKNEKEREKYKKEILIQKHENLITLIEMNNVGILKEGKMFVQLIEFLIRPVNLKNKMNQYNLKLEQLDLILKFIELGVEEFCQITPNYYLDDYKFLKIKVPKRFHHTVKKKYVRLIKKNIFQFFNRQCEEIIKLWKDYQICKEKNQKILFKRGEISLNNQEQEKQLKEFFDQFKTLLNKYCIQLNMKLPRFEEKENPDEFIIKDDILIVKNFTKQFFFENDESRMFYEHLIDIERCLPKTLFEKHENSKNIQSKQLDSKQRKIIDKCILKFNLDNLDHWIMKLDKKHLIDRNTWKLKSKEQLKAEEFFQTLLQAYSKKEIDQLSLEYYMFRNKNLDNLILQLINNLKINNTIKVPLFSRFIATLRLSKIDLVTILNEKIESQFYNILSKKKILSLEICIRNARFLAEFTKFSLFPINSLFGLLFLLVRDFTSVAIQLLVDILENCGKFLYLNSHTHPRLNKLIEIIRTKQTKVFLSKDQEAFLENSIYSCYPPEIINNPPFSLIPIELFIRKLLIDELNFNNLKRILKLVRSLPWKEEKIQVFVKKTLIDITLFRYHLIPQVAKLLGGLSKYEPMVVFFVIESLFEIIQHSMELHNVKNYQRDLIILRFLGEMLRWRLIDTNSVFQLLYSLLHFNASDIFKMRNKLIKLDFCIYFRIQSVCILLQTIESFFSRGTLLLKRNRFLFYFLRVLFRFYPLPASVNDVVEDLLESQKKFIRPNNFQQLEKKCIKIDEFTLKNQKKKEKNQKLLDVNISTIFNQKKKENTNSFFRREKYDSLIKTKEKENIRVRIKEQEELRLNNMLSKIIRESLEEIRYIKNSRKAAKENIRDLESLAFVLKNKGLLIQNEDIEKIFI